MFKYLRNIALLSLARGSYKYLQSTSGLGSDGDAELLKTAGNIYGFAAPFGEVCQPNQYNLHCLAALSAGVIIWFIVDTVVEYDENGLLRIGF